MSSAPSSPDINDNYPPQEALAAENNPEAKIDASFSTPLNLDGIGNRDPVSSSARPHVPSRAGSSPLKPWSPRGYRRTKPPSPLTSPLLDSSSFTPLHKILADTEEYASSSEEGGGGAARGEGENRTLRLSAQAAGLSVSDSNHSSPGQKGPDPENLRDCLRSSGNNNGGAENCDDLSAFEGLNLGADTEVSGGTPPPFAPFANTPDE